MSEWRRHAIYFAPAPGPLARFGAEWLGRDAATDAVAGPPPGLLPFLAAQREAITAGPRRYGFHATLKAPFRLAEDATVDDLDAAAAALARTRTDFALPLRVAVIGRFVALVPHGDTAEIDALAAACVTRLDPLRAPHSAAELARRRAAGLDAEGMAYLLRWGYPYVLDRFRFHMTLTGSLGDGREEVRAALAETLAPMLAAPVAIDAICRFSEGADGGFRLVRRFPLGAEEGPG
jgi:putative phosphonate metabolism protein